MPLRIRTFLIAFCCFAFSGVANVYAQQAEATPDKPIGSVDRLTLPNEHKLVLRDADAFRLKTSSAYRLKAPWGRPDPTLEPATVLEAPPLPKPELARPFHAEVLIAARESRVEPALIHAVIRAESAYRPQAVSPKGAVGLMQLVPDTAKRYGVRAITNPLDNVRGGARYLSDLLRLFNGNVTLALAAYNAGENAVLRRGRTVPNFPETRQYIPRVLAEYERLQNLAIVATSTATR